MSVYNSSINVAIKMQMINITLAICSMTEISQGYNNYGNYCTMSTIVGGEKVSLVAGTKQNKTTNVSSLMLPALFQNQYLATFTAAETTAPHGR